MRLFFKSFRICEGEPGPDTPEVFTQEQVNSMIGKRIAKVKEELTQTKEQAEQEKKALIDQLEKLREAKGLSEADKESLTSRINDLQSSLQTKEEQQKSELARLKKDYEAKISSATEDAKVYKTRFEKQAISTALLAAASAEGALNPQQIQAMYSSHVKLVQDRDDEGNLLESFTPMLSFTGLDKKKAPVQMELPVNEALKKIREDGLNSNLFKGHQRGGSGTSPLSRDPNGNPQLDSSRPPRKADYPNIDEWLKARDLWKKKFQK